MNTTRITYNEAIDFLLPRHYSGRKPQVSIAFGLRDDNNDLKAVCTIGKPASPTLCTGVCGTDFSNHVFELNRLCRVSEDFDYPLSQFVGYCLRDIGDKIIVSYSDTAMNHHGYIYQALNFLYTGSTVRRTDLWTPGNKHQRHYTSSEQGKFRKVRSPKHRYVIFTGNKRFKKKARKALKYKIQPYPKGDNGSYTLGDYLEPQIIAVDQS